MDGNNEETQPLSIHSDLGDIEVEDSDETQEIRKNDGSEDDDDESEYFPPPQYHVFSFCNVVYIIIAYSFWLIPCFGCFGFHWFLTYRKVYNPLYLGHSFVRITIICFFNALFWFTRLFICDYKFITYPGFIPWDDKPHCRDGSTHAGGDCYGPEVQIFLMIHLTAMFLLFIVWIIDGCTLGISEIFLNWTSRKRRNVIDHSTELNFGRGKNIDGGTSIYKGSCITKICYGSGVIFTSWIVAFTLGLFYTWFLCIVSGGYGSDGRIQGIVSLVISSLLSCLTAISACVWVFLYCVS